MEFSINFFSHRVLTQGAGYTFFGPWSGNFSVLSREIFILKHLSTHVHVLFTCQSYVEKITCTRYIDNGMTQFEALNNTKTNYIRFKVSVDITGFCQKPLKTSMYSVVNKKNMQI